LNARSGAAGRACHLGLGWASEDPEMFVIVNDLVREQAGKDLEVLFFDLMRITSQLVV